MKKIISIIAMVLVVVPFGVKAAEISPVEIKIGDKKGSVSCVENADKDRVCTVSTIITNEESITINLEEVGGAKVKEVGDVVGSGWSVNNPTSACTNGTCTVIVSGPTTGETDLFKFRYTPSNEEGCAIAVNGSKVTTTPTPTTPDQPAQQKPTGPVTPFMALGAIALIAAGAYVTTKNKAKMYRI